MSAPIDEAARERQRHMWRMQKRRRKIELGMMPGPHRLRAAKVTCTHCKIGRPNQRAGLCVVCYRNPEILALYPKGSFSRKGEGQTAPKPGVTCLPTTHQPGTAGKVEAMAARVKAGQPLWHPDDALADPDEHGGFEDRRERARVARLTR